ncbi:hypothetical protein PS645_03401 [Pseudomonas fluorescens]|uniref:Uncharacterized protein n=1 Tax=Pseudomonas fluorescens TaxID=294 RepID=A0A5E6UEH1_PSEFL|nr:hypothetical protein [Pseudomonas fluorescens]VVN03258.1 hypothetical protein PS645_03401 [Pseudomonas fluorescens]
MNTLENFVAVDWRAGKDKIYFFFKDTNTYSRFDIAEDRVEDGYPKGIDQRDWGDFHPYAKHLLFGFATSGIDITTAFDFDSDSLWLFFYKDGIPTVCKYDQDDNRVEIITSVAKSIWHPILPHFDQIITGTFKSSALHPRRFHFLLKDGKSIYLDLHRSKPASLKVFDKTLPGLAPHKDLIITAVQNDRTLADSHYYVFLTQNRYMRYDLPNLRLLAGPLRVSDVTWPGLLRV